MPGGTTPTPLPRLMRVRIWFAIVLWKKRPAEEHRQRIIIVAQNNSNRVSRLLNYCKKKFRLAFNIIVVVLYRAAAYKNRALSRFPLCLPAANH